MKKAWYLGHSANDVSGHAILVGDPDRVDRIAELLDSPRFLPVSRGLKTATGGFEGEPVTIASFGMGAPIAAIVLHELAYLGISRFLRIGTAMYFLPENAGQLLVSESAVGFDGTSPAYAGSTGHILADIKLVSALQEAGEKAGQPVRTGRYASFDAFYRDMFGIDEVGRERADAKQKMLAEQQIMAVDMETSALLAAAAALKVHCATLCLGTVDALTGKKLLPNEFAAGETQLFKIALAAVTARIHRT